MRQGYPNYGDYGWLPGPNSSPSFLANRILIWVLELGSGMLREAAPVPEGLNPF